MGRAGKIVINLTGRLNKCGVISPRFDVAINEIEKWTNNLLPSRQFGYVVLTTSGGIMDHEEAGRKHLGGKILGFSSRGRDHQQLSTIVIINTPPSLASS